MIRFRSLKTKGITLLLFSALIPGVAGFTQQTSLFTRNFESGSWNILPAGWEAELVPVTQCGLTMESGSSSPGISVVFDNLKFSMYGSGGMVTSSTPLNRTLPMVTKKTPFPLANVALYKDLDSPSNPNNQVGGVVTDASTGLPVIGATITIAGTTYTMSVFGGVYLTPQLPYAGAQTIEIGKTGYDPYWTTIILIPGTTKTVNAALVPTAYPPGPLVATLNGTPATAVNLSWSKPVGMYQLIYDDGIQDTLAVCDSAGNLNALKFTPIEWPVRVTGGKVNLGLAANYPSNAPPLTPFTMVVYLADGPGGLPGTPVDSTTVTPTGFGWASFAFSNPVTINSGDFYLAMKQGGIPPHAAGTGIDTTVNQLRSFSRDVAAGGSWIPYPGNFMIRAIVEGSGGPSQSVNYSFGRETRLTNEPSGDQSQGISYQVWRLHQGQESNPNLWIAIATTGTTGTVDNAWPSLYPGPYRWAVKAVYSSPWYRSSTPIFSNVIGNNWTSHVTVCADQSCSFDSKAGVIVKLNNTAYPDTNYTLITDTSGCVHFSGIWNGTYTMQVTKFSYQTANLILMITGDTTLQVSLLHTAVPPTNFAVNNQTLQATWKFPSNISYQFQENWASGSFATNQWNISGGTNWQISSGIGNPAPSAMFNWSPVGTNYNQYLTSKPIAGINAPIMRLKYDIFLDNYDTGNLNTMAVEIWDGTSWSVLKNHDNSDGGIPWTTENLNITSQTDNPAFRIRFHAAGTNSYNINNWNIDNIAVYSRPDWYGYDPCINGYNFYLNDSLIGFTTDTTFQIPPELVIYGQTYTACVRTLYGSILSAPACVTFTSHFLYPPRNLTASYVPEMVTLAWDAPIPSSTPVLTGYNIYRNWEKINTAPVPALTYTDVSVPIGLNSYRVTAIYSSDESLPAGPVVINAVPLIRNITNDTITNGQVNCYNAINTVMVAGNGSTFLVESGGSATMIAGQNILFYPETKVQNGGYMWGYISPGGPWCASPTLPSTGPKETHESGKTEITGFAVLPSFQIYPNPTSGDFALVWVPQSSPGDMVIEIYSMSGERIIRRTLYGERKHIFSLSDKPSGIYFIRMITNETIETAKIIKQ